MKTNKKQSFRLLQNSGKMLILPLLVAGITGTQAAGINTNITDTLPLTSSSPTFTGNVTMPGTGIWNTSGNVGIGTVSPATQLEVANVTRSGQFQAKAKNGGSDAGYLLYDGDTNWGIYLARGDTGLSLGGGDTVNGHFGDRWAVRLRSGNGANQGFIFENMDEKLLMSIRGSDGQTYYANSVGIGITSPAAQLHVKGDLNTALTGTVDVTAATTAVTGTGTAFTTELAVGDAIKIGSEVFTVAAIGSDTGLTLDSAHTAGATGATAYTDDHLLAVENGDGVNKVTVTKGGDVGIGTSTPTDKFHIYETAADVWATVETTQADNAVLRLKNSLQEWLVYGDGAGVDAGQFQIANSGGADRFVIDPNGLIGIGTIAPTEDVEIADTNADGWVSIYVEGETANHTTLELDKGSNSKQSSVRFFTNGTEDWRIGTPDIDETWSDTGKEFFIENEATNEVAFFIDDTDNDISIGSTNPTAKLHIDSDDTPWMKFTTPTYGGDYGIIGSDAVKYFRIFAASGKALSLGSNGTAERVTLESNGDLYVNNSALCVDDGGNNCDDSARTAGTIYAVSTSVSGIDLAENYPTKDDTLQPGDTAMLDSENPVFVKKYDPNEENAVIIGIVSTDPGLLLGEFDADEHEGARKVAIALAGRVPLKVSSENGPIAIGDRITVSKTTGKGTKADARSENIVGIALESLTESDEGTITVFALLEKNEQPEEMCIGDTCVNEEQLKALLDLTTVD